MLFSNRDPAQGSHAIRIVRDLVEIVAILAAGFWAFYVFIYENRIKPSFADPQIRFVASMEKTSERSGAVGVLLKTEVQNTGSVRFYTVGYAVTVLGSRFSLSTRPMPPARTSVSEDTHTYFTLSPFTPVYGFGYLTELGNPNSPHGGELEPGGVLDQEQTFYIPAGRFDVLKTHINACYAKSDAQPVPARLKYNEAGISAVTCPDAFHASFDASSLDLRK
jgi:hypothetical protein